MQDKKMFGFEFMGKFLVIFAIAVIFVSVMGMFAGDPSMEHSSMYALGSRGIAFSTISQLGLLAFIVSILSSIFFSEKLFGNMMVIWRAALMVISIIAVIVIFIIVFGWFPMDYLPGWIGFFISFGICFTGSTVISVVKTKADGKKYDELLEHYKQKQSMDEDE